MDDRKIKIEQWLTDTIGMTGYTIELASGDASFRRYFRITSDEKTSIVMDAPPDKEDCGPYIKVAEALAYCGLHVPEILARDLDQGFLWLSDLGNVQYADVLKPETVDKYYQDAMDALIKLQTASKPEGVDLPPYDHALLMREMELFREWFVGQHMGLELDPEEQKLFETTFEFLARSALDQIQVWVHRDYHSRNLMLVDNLNPGVLDFQDAVVGAITYDLVSLLRDCYIAWPIQQVNDWVKQYHQKLIRTGQFDLPSYELFQQQFDFMGVQRHLKASGIFARLNYRDGKPGYLADIPRTLAYVSAMCDKYDSLSEFGRWIESRVTPRLNPQNGQRVAQA